MIAISIALPVVREAAGGKCQCPDDVIREFGEFAPLAQEVLLVGTLDTRNRIIDRHMITLGTLGSSLAQPREVFRCAISDSAAGIVLVHTHPSGDPSPSPEDIKITRQLVEAGRILEISVLDHVILGRKADGRVDYVSLRETGMVEFKS